MQTAKELGIKVTGISFHVGSAATDPAAFEEAIALADKCFESAQTLGFDMTLLDIGGGFSSGCFSLEGQGSIPAAVNRALEMHFPSRRGVRIISEPGRCESQPVVIVPADGCILYDSDFGTDLKSLMKIKSEANYIMQAIRDYYNYFWETLFKAQKQLSSSHFLMTTSNIRHLTYRQDLSQEITF